MRDSILMGMPSSEDFPSTVVRAEIDDLAYNLTDFRLDSDLFRSRSLPNSRTRATVRAASSTARSIVRSATSYLFKTVLSLRRGASPQFNYIESIV